MAIPSKNDRQGISEHFGNAPYFYLATVRERDEVLFSEAKSTFHKNCVSALLSYALFLVPPYNTKI